jgi:hypothetical protein
LTFPHLFNDDLSIILDKILKEENFALPRYADGEYNVIHGLDLVTLDGWRVTPEDKKFAEKLDSTLDHTEPNYLYGISCRCCDPPKLEFYKNRIQRPFEEVTFSNLFVNGNYPRFKHFLNAMGRSVFVIANEVCLDANYPFEVVGKLCIPKDGISWYREHGESLEEVWEDTARKFTDQLFFISAGPLSELIIHTMYTANPNNTYIDVGSSLDEYTHKRQARAFHSLYSEYHGRNCTF